MNTQSPFSRCGDCPAENPRRKQYLTENTSLPRIPERRNVIWKIGMGVEAIGGGGCKKMCPKFEGCSAPICPIEPEWRKCVHNKDDPVCFYLRQHAKDPLWGQKVGGVARKLINKVGEVYPEIVIRYAPIKNSLARAAISPVKGFLAERGTCRNDLKK